MKRPCKECLFSYEDHEPYRCMEISHIFCPDQDLSEGPAEIFSCYIPCDNLQYLEYLDKKGTE